MAEVTVDVQPQLVPVDIGEGPIQVSVVQVEPLDSFSISVEPGAVPLEIQRSPEVVPVTVSEGLPGPAGAKGEEGPAGPEGPRGPSGEGGDLHFKFTQSSPSAEWVIPHDLDKFPSVSVRDTAGTDIEGVVSWPSSEQVIIEFSAPFSGVAFLN